MTKLRLPTAGNVISEIKSWIAQNGIPVFETNGRVQLYSGPERWIAAVLNIENNNYERAFAQSWDLKTTKSDMIDETPAGRCLNNYNNAQNIYEYFLSIYADDPAKAIHHADKVMRFASREFAKACYGHVETAVCGAGLNRVFFEVELPELMRNDRVETINDVPMQRIKDIYFTQGAYVAYREICKAELDMLQKREDTACGVEIKQDRKERIKFFRMLGKEIFKKIKVGSKDVMAHLAPIRPHVVEDKPIRFIIPKMTYVAHSVQYG
ncbi:MAG: hypothetical protein PHD48_05525 [Alphaproteobacteria bacterium]|nr:hypothetical protein [Alphaproteobacteria bacterium]